ncbi:hypothetical protein ACLOAU_14600 [Niabella sp. CJ426]|uniref:hypothetical protein n=1 Tax=Niabella sp. CJ426 TaxID=3393740 RepID=UPI003D01AFF9
MRVIINDKEIILPTSLSEITLGQRIDFHNKYGKELDEMLTSIIDMEDGPEKEMETVQMHFERMFRTFAFFADVDPESLKESKFIDEIANIYYSSLSVLFEEENKLEPQRLFNWNNEVWELAPPNLNQSSKVKFGEIIDSKQIVQDMIELGNGRWEMMQKLAAIFFRKQDEPYKKEFVYEDSERLQLMRELPMDIALQVGFFLNSSMNFYLNTLMSLQNQE